MRFVKGILHNTKQITNKHGVGEHGTNIVYYICTLFHSEKIAVYHISKREMKFIAEIDVMPLKALLDPQGKAVTGSMKNLGLPEIENVRIGKHITLEVEAASKEVAHAKVDEACKKLLANQIMEFYEFHLKEA